MNEVKKNFSDILTWCIKGLSDKRHCLSAQSSFVCVLLIILWKLYKKSLLGRLRLPDNGSDIVFSATQSLEYTHALRNILDTMADPHVLLSPKYVVQICEEVGGDFYSNFLVQNSLEIGKVQKSLRGDSKWLQGRNCSRRCYQHFRKISTTIEALRFTRFFFAKKFNYNLGSLFSNIEYLESVLSLLFLRLNGFCLIDPIPNINVNDYALSVSDFSFWN